MWLIGSPEITSLEGGRIKHGIIPKNDRDLEAQTDSSKSSHQVLARQKWNKENKLKKRRTNGMRET